MRFPFCDSNEDSIVVEIEIFYCQLWPGEDEVIEFFVIRNEAHLIFVWPEAAVESRGKLYINIPKNLRVSESNPAFPGLKRFRDFLTIHSNMKCPIRFKETASLLIAIDLTYDKEVVIRMEGLRHIIEIEADELD